MKTAGDNGTNPTRSSESRDVVVLGGGLAGLAAATALEETGRHVTLIEGSGCLGGRARSIVHPKTGDELDTGQHVLMGCYEEMIAFLRRLGSLDLIRFQASLAVELAEPGRPRSRLACPELPAPFHLAAGLLRFDALSFMEKLRCLRVMGDARCRHDHAALDRISVADWLTDLGQSENAQRCFWTPVCLATLNATPERASAALLAVVLVKAFMAPGRASSIGLATTGLSRVIAEPARDFLTRAGTEIRLNEPVHRLALDDLESVGLSLRDGRHLKARTLISSVPAHVLQRLLPPRDAQRAPFSSLGVLPPSPIVSVHLWLSRKILTVPFVGLIGTELHWVFDRELTWGTAARAGQLVSLVVSGADELATLERAAIKERCWADLLAALPEAADAEILHWEVMKERAATFRGAPGSSLARFGPETPHPRLLVAGDWTDTGLPATMEGACASGHAAAQVALKL